MVGATWVITEELKLDLEYGKGKTENILLGGKITTNLEDRGYFG